MAVAIIFDIYKNKHINLAKCFNVAIKKYLSLFTVVLIFTLGYYVFTKILTVSLAKYFVAGHERLLFLSAKVWIGPIFIILNFVVAVLLQALFIYAIPGIIIDNKNLFKAIGNSIVFFLKKFIATLILVGLPMLLYIPIIILNANKLFLINKFFPEFILFVVGISIIIGSLIIDPLIIMSTTLLYLGHKKSQDR
ncbi:MAG: hypothetical protein KJ593_05045 [Candidatus Omnitrophica bacterium]|nr:hypothetical protein [Candidatus Omnitrophota bacterium]